MRKRAIIFSLVVILIAFVTSKSEAIPITGDISFGGHNIADSSDFTVATQFTSLDHIMVTSVDGYYSSIPSLRSTPPTMTYATFTAFQFQPPPQASFQLWTLTVGGTTYSFDVLSMTVTSRTANSIIIEGSGIAHMTGFDDTAGTWVSSAAGTGTTFSFALPASAPAPVPEPATLLLLGSGLLALCGFRKKLKK